MPAVRLLWCYCVTFFYAIFCVSVMRPPVSLHPLDMNMNEYTVTYADAAIRFHDLPGQEPPILFVHGLGCASSFDYPQVVAAAELAGHRRILADLLGSGFSDKPEDAEYTVEFHARCLLELVEHLDLDGFHLFGHSMGGAVAISLAAQCQPRLRSLILAESNLDPGGGFFSRKIAARSEEEYVRSGHFNIIDGTRKVLNARWAAGLENSLPRAVHREAVSLISGGAPDWRETLHALKVPTTFIYGEESLPDPDEKKLRKQGIRVEIVPKAGHSMAWDNPAGLARAIRAGLNV